MDPPVPRHRPPCLRQLPCSSFSRRPGGGGGGGRGGGVLGRGEKEGSMGRGAKRFRGIGLHFSHRLLSPRIAAHYPSSPPSAAHHPFPPPSHAHDPPFLHTHIPFSCRPTLATTCIPLKRPQLLTLHCPSSCPISSMFIFSSLRPLPLSPSHSPPLPPHPGLQICLHAFPSTLHPPLPLSLPHLQPPSAPPSPLPRSPLRFPHWAADVHTQLPGVWRAVGELRLWLLPLLQDVHQNGLEAGELQPPKGLNHRAIWRATGELRVWLPPFLQDVHHDSLEAGG
ncbi:unnamed protein product [Closterium sp. Naga37s-1]|nr:unnamed protein product [Closterium sp. Naga37s-1]